MSITNIDDWNQFFYNVGEDFYDLVHDTVSDSNQNTKIVYPYTVSYRGAGLADLGSDSSFSARSTPYLCDFSLVAGEIPILKNFRLLNNTNYTGSNIKNLMDNDYLHVNDVSLTCLNSFVAGDYSIGSDSIVYKRNASNQLVSNFIRFNCDYEYFNGSNWVFPSSTGSIVSIRLNNSSVSIINDYNGYDYYFTSTPSSLRSSGRFSDCPSIVTDSPIIINTSDINVNSTWLNYTKSIYINSGDTISSYTYYIDDSTDYITYNYSVDSDGEPTGYIDINPSAEISFDDLFDGLLNILAPLVGVGLDLPDWTDYDPPVVTGVGGDTYINNGDIVNVDGDYYNVDFPSFTGEYPAETITPIESDVYNIMSIDSMPQLPSLTGIDNGESAVALGSSFTFLDGCGLLMPFVTIAIIRLLISKFRGDS